MLAREVFGLHTYASLLSECAQPIIYDHNYTTAFLETSKCKLCCYDRIDLGMFVGSVAIEDLDWELNLAFVERKQ